MTNVTTALPEVALLPGHIRALYLRCNLKVILADSR